MTYILIDALSLFHRAKHVTTGGTEMKIGLGLHIIFSAILKSWQQFNGTHVVFCLEGRSWRKDVYEPYKKHRQLEAELRTQREKDQDEEYYQAFKDLVSFLTEHTNVSIMQAPGLEADDCIALWIENHPNEKHVIVSTDSDFYQLLSENVSFYNGVKKETWTINGVYDEKNNLVMEKLKPSQIKKGVQPKAMEVNPEWLLFKKIIRGDAGDGVFSAYPGVRETKVKAAFDDRVNRGYAWNDIMQQEWVDTEGKKHRVYDDYLINKHMIDLKDQPIEIKQKAIELIEANKSKDQKLMVGIWLLKFCEMYGLEKIKQNVKPYAQMLAAPYGGFNAD